MKYGLDNLNQTSNLKIKSFATFTPNEISL